MIKQQLTQIHSDITNHKSTLISLYHDYLSKYIDKINFYLEEHSDYDFVLYGKKINKVLDTCLETDFDTISIDSLGIEDLISILDTLVTIIE